MPENSHLLIAALLEAALDKINLARAATAGNPTVYGGHLDTAIFIIDGLRASLNPTAGGQIVQHLADLYRYIERRLTDARSGFDLRALDEVEQLLSETKGAWQAVGGAAIPCAKGLSVTAH